jgi:hypothetical protein
MMDTLNEFTLQFSGYLYGTGSGVFRAVSSRYSRAALFAATAASINAASFAALLRTERITPLPVGAKWRGLAGTYKQRMRK